MLGGAGEANAVRDGGAKYARGCRGRSDQRRQEMSLYPYSANHIKVAFKVSLKLIPGCRNPTEGG